MPLSLFNHATYTHYQSRNTVGAFGHSFGGTAESFGLRIVNTDTPFHLIYRLELRDPAVSVLMKGVSHLPLIYGFHYAAHDSSFTYRVLNGCEIEIVEPGELMYQPDFPYPGHPRHFPFSPVALQQVPYDRGLAEDALSLQGVFGLDGLSPAELARAVGITRPHYSADDIPDPGWTDEEIVCILGRAPFMQGRPSKSCDNPDCPAEIAYRTEAFEIDLPEFADVVGEEPIRVDARDVRVDSMRVIAIHQPERDDKVMWGNPFVQMIFEQCDCCRCIRVSNQCT